jgi:hypothetical protein
MYVGLAFGVNPNPEYYVVNSTILIYLRLCLACSPDFRRERDSGFSKMFPGPESRPRHFSISAESKKIRDVCSALTGVTDSHSLPPTYLFGGREIPAYPKCFLDWKLDPAIFRFLPYLRRSVTRAALTGVTGLPPTYLFGGREIPAYPKCFLDRNLDPAIFRFLPCLRRSVTRSTDWCDRQISLPPTYLFGGSEIPVYPKCFLDRNLDPAIFRFLLCLRSP